MSRKNIYLGSVLNEGNTMEGVTLKQIDNKLLKLD